MKKLFFLLFFLLLFSSVTKPCNICGGGTGELVVLALDGRALFNAGIFYDAYKGVWDQYGTYRKSDFTKNQYRFSLSGAYRFDKHLQFAVTIPYIANYQNDPNFKSSGSSIGDLIVTGRYEFFHEYQLKKKNNKDYIDNKLPYLAVTFGITIPTGKSEESALDEVDVTGKGFFMSSLGISVTKSLIKNRFQISMDLSWQHSFKKTYDTYFGQSLNTPLVKQQGDKFNYSMMFNYIFNSWHAVSLSVMGYSQTPYMINNERADLSEERSLSFIMMYTYYPSLRVRITPQVKWNIPSDNLGRNSTGSTTFGLNLTYYFADYNIK